MYPQARTADIPRKKQRVEEGEKERNNASLKFNIK